MYRHLLLSLFFTLSFFSLVQAQNFKLQVAAYIDPIELSHFENLGLEGVYMQTDQNEIYRYFIGGYENREQAEVGKAKLSRLGFPNTVIIDTEEQRALCGAPCPYINSTSTYIDEMAGDLYVKGIFFDYNKSSLSQSSEMELNILYQMLLENPNYQIRLMAHTDSKGSAAYNLALSKRRARAVRNYLVAKGITIRRINVKVYGESDPIAKNEDNGRDLPEGRKYNRRVVIAITNKTGEIIAEASEPIEVPDYLRN